MTTLVGLGNPGREYHNTRHNAGFLFLDFWQREHDFPAFITEKKVFAEISRNKEVTLVKPQTFMNDSGRAVKAALKWYGSEESNLYVFYDDLDLEIGKYKIQFGRGPKIHNGLNSIRQQIDTNSFWHVRLGVDGRNGDRTLPGHVYVLQHFTDTELPVIKHVFSQIADELVSKL